MELLLLKALCEGDFHVCAYLLNASLRGDDKISVVFSISEALETANYEKFWVLFNGSDAKKLVPQFGDKARQIILNVVGLTYQRIDPALLVKFLNVSSEADVRALVDKRQGWKLADGVVEIPVKAPAAAAASSAAQATITNATFDQQLAVLAATGAK